MKTIKLTKSPKLPFDGATIEYHNTTSSFNPNKIVLHLEPEQENGYIKGTILAERLKEKSCNASVLDYLIEHPELYPEAWKGKYVYFWGSIFRSPSDDNLCVRCGYWRDGKVVSDYDWLDVGWHGRRPAAVLKQVSTLNPDTQSSSDPLPLDLRVEKLESQVEIILNWAKKLAPPEL